MFLSEDSYQKAKEYLLPKALKSETEEKYKKHLALTIDSWTVELHGNIKSGLSRKVDKMLDDIYRDSFSGGCVRTWKNGSTSVSLLGIDNEVIYVFVHILQHFFHGGIGLRQVCDWCRLLWMCRDVVDFKILEKRIRAMRLKSEWKAFAYFVVNELGMPVEAMPFYESGPRWIRKSRIIKRYIIRSGNFGHRDLRYVKESPYMIRKIRSFCGVMNDFFKHFIVFSLDSFRYMLYYSVIQMGALSRGE